MFDTSRQKNKERRWQRMAKVVNTGLAWGHYKVGPKQVRLSLNAEDCLNNFMPRLSHFLDSLARICSL